MACQVQSAEVKVTSRVCCALLLCAQLSALIFMAGCAGRADDGWSAHEYKLQIMRRYSPIFNRVEVIPKTPDYHAVPLRNAKDPNEAAYHILAIGTLRKDTPAVSSALEYARHRFGRYRWPERYEWPHVTEAQITEIERGGKQTVFPSPYVRRCNMWELVLECYHYIESEKDRQAEEPE